MEGYPSVPKASPPPPTITQAVWKIIYRDFIFNILFIIGIQPLGRFGHRLEHCQVTAMALVCCILGKFLRVVCHCFPPIFNSMMDKIFFNHLNPIGNYISHHVWYKKRLVFCPYGARGGVVFEALRYKPVGRGFDSRWCHWNFSMT